LAELQLIASSANCGLIINDLEFEVPVASSVDQQRLFKSERQLAEAQELAHVGSFEWNIEDDEVNWSDELYRIYGLEPRQFEATYEAFLERIHPDDRAAVDANIRRCVQKGEPFQMEERILRPDGEVRVLESRGYLAPGRRLVGVCRDVTELRALERERAEAAAREREARLVAEAAHEQVHEILERVTDAFVALDRNWYYTYVNRKAAEIFGRERESMIGKHIWTEFPEGVGQPFHLAYERAMATQQPIDIEEYYEPYDRWFENRIYPSPNGLAIYFQDVTERRRIEERVRHQALHDDLTGLPNRVLFNDRLEQAIVQAQRHESLLTVITVDLDNFKLINDNFGHSFGDVVIRDVGMRLRSSLRMTDTIARLSGDEFAVIVVDIRSEAEALAMAAKVREALADPFDVGRHSASLTTAIGISLYPRDGHDAEMLFRNSVAALNRAKEIGTDSMQLFDETMSVRFRDRLVLEQELRTAIQERQLVPWYQPIVRSSDLKVVAVEALSRWIHPQRGIVEPDRFIPLAEESRLIVPLGQLALRSACTDIGPLAGDGFGVRLSVNLSARQFRELDLLRSIDDILAETSFPPSNLELEVTESVTMDNADLTMNLLRDLRERKITIAIDDFGVGQTSLIYLRSFPINTIKIDKVFISDMLTDPTAAAIVQAVISLAHTLGVITTAEGVESEEQMKMLQEFGCDLVQGYYVARPMPLSQLVEWLRR
jgi:diguanylate cyclase (GGDEF)-like protein/PAS domain S-box-containing protein